MTYDEAVELMRASDALVNLVNQIRKTSPADDHGHLTTMNMAYIEAVKLLDGATEAGELDVKIRDELHPDTAKLVWRFARSLANKLLVAQRKYGYGASWADDDWQDKCRADLMKHIAKGDPRDVAAYRAFRWHHNWSTATTPSATAHAALTDERAALDKALERMDRARSILTNGDPRPECNWGMLDTSDLRKLLATNPSNSAEGEAS